MGKEEGGEEWGEGGRGGVGKEEGGEGEGGRGGVEGGVGGGLEGEGDRERREQMFRTETGEGKDEESSRDRGTTEKS